MRGPNIHVVPWGFGWGVKQAGEFFPVATATTQAEAIRIGRNLAKKNQSELFIHGQDGAFRERNTYGRDPFPPRG